MQEPIQAATLQPAHPSAGTHLHRRSQSCWGCGQPGHLLKQCPRLTTMQGNTQGSVWGTTLQRPVSTCQALGVQLTDPHPHKYLVPFTSPPFVILPFPVPIDVEPDPGPQPPLTHSCLTDTHLNPGLHSSPTQPPLTPIDPTEETQHHPVGEAARLSAVRDIWAKNCDGLSRWEQEELWQVMLEFKDIFALNESEVGLTHLVQHKIDTGDACPIKVHPRHLPLAHQEAADNELDEMLRAGIIEPSDSP
ncbi:hypothetical protein LDENG_00192460 [Lucifuga dentata]|nr:hypothetical protein LDENG_00192460 [Lucifuga dentata]